MEIQTKTLTPSVAFKQLIEPQKDKYTHKQMTLATQVGDIFTSESSIDKNGRNWIQFLEDDYDLDVIIEPSANNRKKIFVTALNRSTGAQEIISSYSQVKKPNESDIVSCLDYLKEKAKEENNNVITTMMLLGLITLGAIFLPGSKSNQVNQITQKAAKTEIVTKALNTISQDTLQLVAKTVR